MLAVVGAACGGDDDDAGAAGRSPAPADTPTAPNVEDVLDDVDGLDVSELLDEAGVDLDELDVDELDLDLPAMPSVGGGECSVRVTGDKQAEWSESQNVSTASISYWYGDQERALLGDDFTWLVNCSGVGNDGLSVFTGDVTADQVPMAPGTYDLPPGASLFGGSTSGPFIVMLVLADSETTWGIAEPGGTLTIDEFDEGRLRFTVDAPFEDSLANLGSEEGTLHLNAEFLVTNG